jgi:hypothetical protein
MQGKRIGDEIIELGFGKPGHTRDTSALGVELRAKAAAAAAMLGQHQSSLYGDVPDTSYGYGGLVSPQAPMGSGLRYPGAPVPGGALGSVPTLAGRGLPSGMLHTQPSYGDMSQYGRGGVFGGFPESGDGVGSTSSPSYPQGSWHRY